MLRTLGFDDLDSLIDATVPKNIRLDRPLELPAAKSERDALAELREIREQEPSDAFVYRHRLFRLRHAAGHSAEHSENPGWYTAYTPYQAELAQGRLEALLNFQTMVTDLTALDISNASLLDEATAAAEAMALCHAVVRAGRPSSSRTIVIRKRSRCVQTGAKPLGIEVRVEDFSQFKFDDTVFGALVQYPATDGAIYDYESIARSRACGRSFVRCRGRILALTLLRPPGEFGADVAVGSTQRFGVPLGFGGPMLHFSRRATNTNATCRVGWWAFRMMLPESLLIGSHCKRASSTSAATKRRVTSARRRFFSPLSRRCTPFITGRKVCVRSQIAFTTLLDAWRVQV